eukprot:CAMPEP_0173056930 /NCGR_PEP_ID=MMETSP1102-20130122/426_1 /TAXON_ID=49646 /ORGANISM="Geminigera sp., Strain Caron Lab Isolate" /LENGTH=51 /DNA_ID=CAMNT_0013922325 /DNA_START=595 /DNA_END=750 /DNA_ORIENTATION=-
MARFGHNSVVKKLKKLHEITPRRLKAWHLVRKVVRHLKDLSLVGGGAKGCE